MLKELQNGINEVFTIEPRNANENPKNWITRPELHDFTQSLFSDGLSICIDGPTGVGKSSLATSGLHSVCFEHGLRLGFVVVQCESNMSWGELCWQFVQGLLDPNLLAGEGSEIAKASVSINAYFAKIGVDWKKRDISDIRRLKEYVLEWGINDLAKIVHDTQVVLCIDDAEKLSDDLFEMIADLCKKFSGTKSGKLVVVGMGDIYRRTLEYDPSLDGRIREIVLGGLSDQLENRSWNYLCDGLKSLGFHEPRELIRRPNQTNYRENKALIDQCIAQIFDATSGIPKLLNVLGARLALFSAGTNSRRRNVTTSDFLEVTEDFIREQITKNSRSHRELIKIFQDDVTARLVIAALVTLGISRPSHIEDIVRTIQSNGSPQHHADSEVSIVNAINHLVEQKILVRTGPSNDVVYALDPPVIHSFGVAIKMREKYKISGDHFGELGQLQLPLLLEDASPEPRSVSNSRNGKD